MFERECLLLFILIYHIKRTSSICGQASGEEITYLYDYSANDSPTSIYTPTVISAEPSLTCKSTVKAGVLKNETFLCNRLCVTTMTPLIKKTNTTTSYNYTNDFLVPAGFEINRHIQPVICAKTSELCGATKPLYWNKNTGELSLTNDYDPFDKPICFIWGEDSSQYQRMLKTQQNQCPTPGSTKKSRRNKRNLPFDFWGGGRNQSNEADKSTDNDWMNNNTDSFLASQWPRCIGNLTVECWFGWSHRFIGTTQTLSKTSQTLIVTSEPMRLPTKSESPSSTKSVPQSSFTTNKPSQTSSIKTSSISSTTITPLILPTTTKFSSILSSRTSQTVLTTTKTPQTSAKSSQILNTKPEFLQSSPKTTQSVLSTTTESIILTSAPKTPCTSNSSRFDWFPWCRISKQAESTTPSTIFTTRVTTNQPSTNQPISQPNPSTSRLVTSTTVAVRKSEQTTKVTFPTLDPDNITRRRPRDLSNELNDTSSSSSTSKTTSSSPTTSTPSSTTTSTTTTTAVSSSSGGRSASSSSSTSTIATTTTFRSSSQSGISIPSSSTASSSSSSTTTAQSSSGIASSSTSRSSTVTQSRSSQSSQSSSSIASTSRATETSRSSIPASSTTIHSSSWSSTRLSSSSTHIASSSRSTNLANNVTVPTPPINQTIGPAGTSPSIPSSVTFTNKASSFRSQNQTIGPGGTSQAGISGNVSFATTTPKGIILASSTPASSSTTVSSIVQTTTSNINSKKSAICSALSNLENSNTISLSAVTSILSQYNVTLDDALNALNLSLAQISTMSVSEIIDNATASCQGYVSSVITLRTRQTTNRVSGTTYNGVTYDNGDGNSNNNSVGPNYGGGRTRSYQNYNGSSGYDDGGDTLIVVPIPDRSYSQQDREDRDNDNGDYWYDGTTYQYNHRIWRWVLLGVFCALIVAIAFALLCFACYRPYRPSTTTTIVTPLPVTEKIYTSSGHVDVPPLPISPMPAYSNAATLRL